MHLLCMESCLEQAEGISVLTIACARVVMTVVLQSRIDILILKLKLRMVTVVMYFWFDILNLTL